MVTGGIMAVVVLGIAALVLRNFAGRIGDEDNDGDDWDESRTCTRGIHHVYSLILKSFPLTAFKTVI